MAESNIEKFLIEFGFKGDKALRKLKEFTREYNKLNKQVVENTRVTKAQSNAEKQRVMWLNQVRQQKKKLSSVDRYIEKKEQDAIKRKLNSEKELASFREHATKRRLEMQKRIEASARRINSVYNKRRAIENRVARLSGALQRSRAFEALMDVDPAAARELKERFETGVRKGDEKAIQSVRNAMASYGKQVASTRNKVLSLKTAQRGLTDSTRNMIRAYVSLFAVLKGVSSINKVGQSFEAMESAMLAAAGGKEEAASSIRFLDELTSRLGMSLIETSDQYTKFLFAAKGKLDTDQVNEFFESVAEAGTVLGISKERMKLSFNALQQMLNKTTVQSEELKRQLAESFPGAIQIFARAIGKSEEEMFKMMENGELLAAEIFPDVAREMKKVANTAGALEQKYKTTRVAQGRFFKELEKAQNIIFKGGFDESMAEMLNFLAGFLKENQQALKSFGEIFESVFNSITIVLKVLMPIVESAVTVFSQLVQTVDGIFVGGSSGIIAGIYAITRAMKGLNLVAKSLALKFLLILGVLDEIFAPFIKGRVGIIERAFDKDLGLDPKNIDLPSNEGTLNKDFIPNIKDIIEKDSILKNSTGLPSDLWTADKIRNFITQHITVEVPAGANEEHFKKIVEDSVNSANERLINNTYPGGD